MKDPSVISSFAWCREAPTMLGKSASKAAGKLSRKTEKREIKKRIRENPELRVRKKKKVVKKGGKNNKGGKVKSKYGRSAPV